MVQIGDYIIYPAFFILLIVIFVLLLVVIAIKNIVAEKKQEKTFYQFYKITKWQRKHLIEYMSEYLREHDVYETHEKVINQLQKYMDESKFWNVDELLEIDKGLVMYVSAILFEVAKENYIRDDIDGAVLILNAFDFINGGMEDEDTVLSGQQYQWIGSDIVEMRNSSEMTDEEARTLFIYDSAVIDLYDMIDPDLGKIPERAVAEEFCKRLTQSEIEDALDDIETVIDILALTDKSRDIIIKALFNKCSFLMGEIFGSTDENNKADYMDEYRRYTMRALAAAIDNQLYSDVIESISFDE